MKEYKENEVRKDMFYEEQKREKIQDALRERMENEKSKKNWLKLEKLKLRGSQKLRKP